MRAEEREYAVSFAVPSDTEGVFFIYGRQPSDTRRMEAGDMDVGNVNFGGQEALIIFENVFVPSERVFLKGEYQFCRYSCYLAIRKRVQTLENMTLEAGAACLLIESIHGAGSPPGSANND